MTAGALAVDLETRQTLVDIGDVARLAELAVIDHVNADISLSEHDLADGLRKTRLIGGAARGIGFADLYFGHSQKIGWPWQAAGMGGQDTVDAAFHGGG